MRHEISWPVLKSVFRCKLTPELTTHHRMSIANDIQRLYLEPLADSLKIRVLHIRKSGCENHYRDIKQQVLLELGRREDHLKHSKSKR